MYSLKIIRGDNRGKTCFLVTKMRIQTGCINSLTHCLRKIIDLCYSNNNGLFISQYDDYDVFHGDEDSRI